MAVKAQHLVHSGFTLNSASVYWTNRLYLTPNPHYNPSPLAQ